MHDQRAQPVAAQRRRWTSRAGFTLLELVIVMSVLTISVAIFSSTVASTARWGPAAQKMSLASEAARGRLETLRSEPFGQVFALYNSDPSDDPLGPGTAPGPGFAVPGLEPMPGDPDGLVGEVLFSSPGPTLHENVDLPLLGMPRDLTGDSFADDRDHAGDYVLLPALVRVRWQESGGAERSFEICTMFVDLEASR